MLSNFIYLHKSTKIKHSLCIYIRWRLALINHYSQEWDNSYQLADVKIHTDLEFFLAANPNKVTNTERLLSLIMAVESPIALFIFASVKQQTEGMEMSAKKPA